jgi:16S rRNA (cytosine1402-N4)-methyltransferase
MGTRFFGLSGKQRLLHREVLKPKRGRENMVQTQHAPVMESEVLDLLEPAPTGWYIDATFGGGGHTKALLDVLDSESRLLAVDRDPEAIERGHERIDDERVRFEQLNYGKLPEYVEGNISGPVTGLLVDAGLSSDQLDDPERGFSFQGEQPLDMRMGPDAPRAETYLESTPVEALSDDLRDYGDIRSARAIASEIRRRASKGQMETTDDLKTAVQGAIDSDASDRLYALVFQAIRMAVNKELESLRRLVDRLPDVLDSSGRVVFISFHSGEDRVVKHGLRRLANDCVCPPDLPICGCNERKQVEVLTSGPLTPTREEIERNSRSRSAKLRAAELIN